MNISIHKPSALDIKELHQLFILTITDAFEKEGLGDDYEGINDEIEEKKKFLKEDIETNGKIRFFLIARCKEKIVGTIAYGPCGDLIVEGSKGKYKDMGEIGTVFVLPGYQNKGIGTLLLNSMFLALISKDIEAFCLDSGYTRAQRVWSKKLGEPNIVMKDYWSEGHDHLIWYRKLEDITIPFKIS